MTTGTSFETIRVSRSAVGSFMVCMLQKSFLDRHILFRPLMGPITVVLLTLSLLLFPSAPAFGQAASGDEQGVQRSSASRRGSSRRVQSSRNARRAVKEKAKRDQEEKGPNGPEGEVDTSSDTSGGQGEGSALTNEVKAAVDESGRLGDANKRGDRFAPTNRKSNNAGALTGGAKTIEQANAGAAAQYSHRMEFDARLVYGETAGSGAVILFERGQRQLPPLTEQRKRFLSATVEPVFGKKYEPLSSPQDTLKGVEIDKTDNRSVIDGSRN